MDSYICAVIFNGLCRISVPIFFMISGALLLEQSENLKKNAKRTAGIFLKTAVWTVVFIVWDFFYLGEGYALQNVFAYPVRVHFWFMYVLFGIYITIPFWQRLVNGSSKALLCYFSLLFISVSAINFILRMLKMNVTYEIPLFGSSCYVGYFIMGYIIRHYTDEIKIKRWVCIAVWAVCSLVTSLLTLLSSLRLGCHVEFFSDFRSIFIALAAMSVFCIFMKMKNPKPHKWIAVISKHSFNIYMMHVLFLDILQQNIDITKFTAWLGFPAFFAFMLATSLAFSFIYEKAKGKRLSML